MADLFDSPSAPAPPAPDPAVGQAAMYNAEVGREAVQLGREQFQDAKARYDRFEPAMMEAIGLQSAVAKDNRARSTAQWDDYLTTFRPAEQRMAKEANEWDSDVNLDRAAQVAGADVAKGYSAARGATVRDMTRMGLNPNSGKFLAAQSSMGLSQAKDTAGAMNNARDTRRLQGMAMRENVAKFGRGMPSTGLAADQLSLAGAAGSAGTANNTLMAKGAATNQALPWYQAGIGATSASGNLGLGMYQGQLGAWNSQMQAESQASAGMGQLLGTGLGLAGQYFRSSKELKEGNEPVDGEDVLLGLKSIPVEKWKYKDGVADGGEHVGPYAEDVHREFGDQAAPGGAMLDPVTMNGLTLAAVKALAKKVEKLEKNGGLGLATVKRRDTEPRRAA